MDDKQKKRGNGRCRGRGGGNGNCCGQKKRKRDGSCRKGVKKQASQDVDKDSQDND